MIVGIGTYTGTDALGLKVPDLKGSQNDAAAIEQAVRKLKPATLVRLGWDAAAGADKAVTRADFFRTWEQTLAAAASGDRLLLTFAGHCSRVPVLAGNPGEEADEMDETMVLTAWNASDGRNAEHIIDDELTAMVEAADKKGVIVIFVADCSHAGTLVDRIPPGLVFIAGALETQTAPEILDPATNRRHGALSLAFAEALAGGAVKDGAVTTRSLETFVLRRARLLSERVEGPARRPTRVSKHGAGIAGEMRLFVVPKQISFPDSELQLR